MYIKLFSWFLTKITLGNEDEETYFIPNFDVIINNIQKLNRIAGEGEHKIHKTYSGATLKVCFFVISKESLYLNLKYFFFCTV